MTKQITGFIEAHPAALDVTHDFAKKNIHDERQVKNIKVTEETTIKQLKEQLKRLGRAHKKINERSTQN